MYIFAREHTARDLGVLAGFERLFSTLPDGCEGCARSMVFVS
jgi:hypothetical protein